MGIIEYREYEHLLCGGVVGVKLQTQYSFGILISNDFHIRLQTKVLLKN